MINHARNLLMNTSETAFSSSILLEEVIDPNFKAKKLPAHLASVRRVIFGEAPDRCMLNYRCRQLLALLHAGELSEFVTDLDSRITYDLTEDLTLMDQSVFALTANQTTGIVNEIAVVGTYWCPDQQGKIFHQWRVNYNLAQTSVTNNISNETVTYTPSFSGGLSNPMKLVGSPVSIMHRQIEASWVITYIARPERSFGAIYDDIEALGPDTVLKLFGVGSNKTATEPFKTFYNLWQYHPMLTYRLSGAILALIYQTNEIP